MQTLQNPQNYHKSVSLSQYTKIVTLEINHKWIHSNCFKNFEGKNLKKNIWPLYCIILYFWKDRYEQKFSQFFGQYLKEYFIDIL